MRNDVGSTFPEKKLCQFSNYALAFFLIVRTCIMITLRTFARCLENCLMKNSTKVQSCIKFLYQVVRTYNITK